MSNKPRANQISVNTSNFIGNLSSSDNDIQKALNTIDKFAISNVSLVGGGDVDGYLSNLTVVGLYGRPLTSTVPLVGQAYVYDGVNWAPGNVASSSSYHNQLLGLQGGSADSYYHLTADQHNGLLDGYNNGWAVTKGGTGLTTISTGSLLYGSSTNTISQLLSSTDGYFLSLSGGLPIWTTVQTGVSSHNSLSGLQGGTTNEYYHLSSDAYTWVNSSITSGVSVITGGTGLTTYNTGDILYASNPTTLTKLSSSDDGYLLNMSSGVPVWKFTIGYLPGAPIGFENRTDSYFSFDDTSMQFLVKPSNTATHYLYFNGQNRYAKYGIDTVNATTDLGIHWFYFVGNTLTHGTAFPGFASNPIANMYWDGYKSLFLGDERHGAIMDSATHTYLHNTIGTRYSSGLTLARLSTGTGNVDTDCQFSITDGVIFDEDIQISIKRSATPLNFFEQELGLSTSIPGKFPIYYRLGSATNNWTKLSATTFPVTPFDGNAGSRIGYNLNTVGSWSIADSGANGDRIAVWMFATNDTRQPVIALMGQRFDASLANAQTNNSYQNLSLGTIPFAEMRLIYRVIVRTSTGYANSIKAYIEDVEDLRSINNVPGATYVATDHGSLTGLTNPNSHPATAISTDTTNFNNILSVANTDVQSSLDTLDDHTHSNTTNTTFQIHYSTGPILNDNNGTLQIRNYNNTADGYIEGYLRPPAGSRTSNTSPLKFTAGTLNNSVEDGAVEYDGYKLSIGIGTTRKIISTNNKILITAGKYDLLLSGSTNYLLPNFSETDSESQIAYLVPYTGTIDSLNIYCDTAPGGSETVAITLRKNSSDASVTATLSGSNKTTSDLINSFSVSSGDKITIKCVTSSSSAAKDLYLTFIYTYAVS